MNVVYYTSGLTGSGRVVRGLSIWNAFQRAGVRCQYTILSTAPFAHLAERLGVPHVEIPMEGSANLGPDSYVDSQLFRALSSLQPDILLVDLYWMPFYAFLGALSCKKVFLSRQVVDSYFSIPFQGGRLDFRPEDYDLVLATEPFKTPFPIRSINPMVIRNPDEILPRPRALAALGLEEGSTNCLLTYNGEPGEFEQVRKSYSHLEEEGYRMVYSTNYQGGLFPAVDYFNAIDLLVCSAAYNSFWEAVFFRKKAIFAPVRRRFENQMYRIQELQDHRFEENGADQLVPLVMDL
jgi:hypothetical protein